MAGAMLAAQAASQTAYHYEDAAALSFFGESAKQAWPRKEYCNPMALALTWHRALSDGKCASRADLARKP